MTPDAGEAIAHRLQDVRRRIAEAAVRAAERRAATTAQAASPIVLVAVSKGHPASAVLDALRSGQTVFGENRVQEGLRKATEVAAGLSGPAPSWHLLGPLQSNKVRAALDVFPVLHAVDRLSILEAVGREAERLGRRIEAFLEVNVSGETAKHGFSPDELRQLAGTLTVQPAVRLVGLMTVPPFDPNPEASRPFFRRLRELRDELRRLKPALWGDGPGWLSMGMSGDFEVAIEEGATHVRVGTAIFGERGAT